RRGDTMAAHHLNGRAASPHTGRLRHLILRGGAPFACFVFAAGGTAMIFRSPYPDVPIPDVSLTPFVLRPAPRLADMPSLIDASSGRTLTYGALAQEVRAVAAGLVHRGFRKGDVFGIYAPNCPEYAVALLAITSIGGIATTVNPLATADELA